ncbi:MAG: hypothetical protein WB780_08460 [Candidatus Acidiferrales bacterium]
MEKEILLTEERKKDPEVIKALDRMFVDIMKENNTTQSDCTSDRDKLQQVGPHSC